MPPTSSASQRASSKQAERSPTAVAVAAQQAAPVSGCAAAVLEQSDQTAAPLTWRSTGVPAGHRARGSRLAVAAPSEALPTSKAPHAPGAAAPRQAAVPRAPTRRPRCQQPAARQQERTASSRARRLQAFRGGAAASACAPARAAAAVLPPRKPARPLLPRGARHTRVTSGARDCCTAVQRPPHRSGAAAAHLDGRCSLRADVSNGAAT